MLKIGSSRQSQHELPNEEQRRDLKREGEPKHPLDNAHIGLEFAHALLQAIEAIFQSVEMVFDLVDTLFDPGRKACRSGRNEVRCPIGLR
jgi:hypothetical protein